MTSSPHDITRPPPPGQRRARRSRKPALVTLHGYVIRRGCIVYHRQTGAACIAQGEACSCGLPVAEHELTRLMALTVGMASVHDQTLPAVVKRAKGGMAA